MATISSAARNAACDAIVDLFDVGGAGKLILQESGPSTLATLTFNSTAFGDASTGVATLVVSPAISATASATGTASLFSMQQNDDTEVISGTVATSGGDITIDNTSVTSGQTVNLNSLTVTVPAS
jgi:hypothetical protein